MSGWNRADGVERWPEASLETPESRISIKSRVQGTLQYGYSEVGVAPSSTSTLARLCRDVYCDGGR